MDKSAGQFRLSRAQLPPQGAGNPSLSLDQLSDLDQAINLSRGDRPATRPAPVITRSVPRPVVPQGLASSKPAPSQKPQNSTQTTAHSQSQASALKPEAAPEPPAVPVRSAKEAINAMYAAENPARLSDYLGTSAKEIINATARNNSERDTKSAASLHHASSQRRMETSRPSASAIFRAAKSETTVVRTSLELDPKSPRTASKSSAKPSPIVINSRSRAARPQAAPRPVDSVRPKKGQIKITTPSATSIAVSAIEQAAGAITGTKTAKNPAKSAANGVVNAASQTFKSQSPRPRGGLVQDIARPVRRAAQSVTQTQPTSQSQSAQTQPSSVTSSKTSSKFFSRTLKTAPKVTKSAKTAAQTLKSAQTQNDPYQKLPTDSVKRRFRLAPKGFAAQKPEQARPARRKFMSFSNPDYSVPIPKATPAVEIYGLEPEPEERNKDGLGIVEDYRPTSSAQPNAQSAQKPSSADAKGAADTRHTPDNNRYALGGQSPFFLKTVNVEKRPLSDAPTRRSDTISPIYTDPGDDRPRKNVYDGKSKPAKSTKSTKKSSPRDLPQRPTVIIPSSRRSHTPLFLLLILTVILGAAVGAAVYFFFFQPTLNDTPSTSSRITVESQEY